MKNKLHPSYKEKQRVNNLNRCPKIFASGDSEIPYIIAGGRQGSERLNTLARATWPTTFTFLKRAGLKQGVNLLDVGCGNGVITKKIADFIGPQGSIVGIDVDKSVIEFAKSSLQRDKKNITYEVINIENEQLDDIHSYDFIYARFLLSHLKNPRAVLSKLVSKLKPTGIIAVEDTYFDGHRSQPTDWAFDRYVALFKEVAFKQGTNPNIGPVLEDLFREVGLNKIKIEKVTPMFSDGAGKRMALLTMEAIQEKAITLGLASTEELHNLVSELRRFTANPRTTMSIPTIYQVVGRKGKK